MTIASEAYEALLTKAAAFDSLRTQAIALIEELKTLEVTIMNEVGPKDMFPHNNGVGGVANGARCAIGLVAGSSRLAGYSVAERAATAYSALVA